ncbi:hypothetical protein [Kocuria tytonicola]|uniref:hypothetical protein n=1 Tax=Kocuria tytonicola TaxID=2055946 RepID=UPI000F51A09D|nr:hypothetical protein [Kocuria tytonicola]
MDDLIEMHLGRLKGTLTPMAKALKDFVAEHSVDRERVEGYKERMLSDAHAYRLRERLGTGGLSQAPLAQRDGLGRRQN